MKRILTLAIALMCVDAYAVTSSAPRSSSGAAKSAPVFKSAPTFKPTTTVAPSKLKSDTSSVSGKFGQSYNFDNAAKKQAASTTYNALRPETFKPKYVPPADVNRYRTTYKANPVFNTVRNDRNAYRERQAYYSQPTHVVYVRDSSPSFGLLSGIFAYSLLSNAAQAAEYAHNHNNDADYIAWRREADRLAQSNAELKAQLNAADAQASAYTAKPVDPNWIPPGVPAAATLSDEALKAAEPDLNVCVGPTNGLYYKTAQQYMLTASADVVNIVPVVTKGSPDIVQKLADGKCDAGFIQGDTKIDDSQYTTIFKPFLETAHLICHDASKVSKLSDVLVLNIAGNSGSMMTWQNFVAKDNELDRIIVQYALTNEDALAKTLSTKSCLFYVAAPHSSALSKLFERPELWLVPIDDQKLVDINYNIRTLSSSDLPEEIRHGMFSSGEIKTIAMPAKFVISNKWRTENTEAAGKLSLELLNIEQQIHEQAADQH